MAENSPAIIRLKNDYKKIIRDPVPNVLAVPLQENFLEWHFVVIGSENTPYEGGYYHGKLLFPNDFPFKPPKIMMLTPSGRFEPNKPICFSMSDYHPESWNPSWTVSTIIMGVISFMNDSAKTTGSMETTDEMKREFAQKSKQFNLENPEFCRVFPDLVPILKNEQEAFEVD